jgi:hypothetical protein
MLDSRVISDTVDRDCALPALARHDSGIPSLQTYDPVQALYIFGNEIGYLFVKANSTLCLLNWFGLTCRYTRIFSNGACWYTSLRMLLLALALALVLALFFALVLALAHRQSALAGLDVEAEDRRRLLHHQRLPPCARSRSETKSRISLPCPTPGKSAGKQNKCPNGKGEALL